MHSQRAPLNEAFVAVLERAAVWSFVGVYSVMSAEVGPASEGLDELAGNCWANNGKGSYFSATLPGAVEITSSFSRHDGWCEKVRKGENRRSNDGG